MHTLVFDIETVGEDWDSLDETTRGVLTRWVERSARGEAEREAGIKDVREGLGFSPLTGRIVALGLYDLERGHGAVYYEGTESEDIVHGAFVLKSRSEKDMLSAFWEGARQYETFVTFNGRGFDVPYLNLRSAVHGIRPTYDLMDGRYFYQQKHVRHVDLQDQLTFYGAMHKKPSLHLFCRAFGIESPKEDIAGDDVARLVREGEIRRVAEYNVRDVLATTALYERWRTHLAPQSFLEL